MGTERRLAPSTRRLAVAAVLGCLSAFLSLLLAPPAISTVGPARVRASTDLGAGTSRVELPPLGTVLARTHAGPVDLRLAIVEIDFEELGPLATTPAGRQELRTRVTNDVARLAQRAAIQELSSALVIAAVISAAVFHRRWRPILTASVISVAVLAGLGAVAASTYRVAAFDQPSFTGTLTRAREVVATIQRSQDALDAARSRYEIATRRFSDLLALVARQEQSTVGGDDTAILHVSDVHANPIGLEIAQELAREFQVDAVIDTGDLASSILDTGELSTLAAPIDRGLARSVQRIGIPYYFVRGNHDSPQLLAALARAANVQILDGTGTFIAGIEVVGWPDPTFSTRPVAGEDKANERRLVGERDVRPAVLDQDPDLLAVHDERLAEASYGAVPLVLAGHTHARDMKDVDGTRILTVGSTGATGVNSFAVEADLDHEAQILYFRGDDLRAVDYVSVRRLGSDFNLERRTFDDAA